MSERKVLNKYFPPDWDPAVLTKKRKQSGIARAAKPQIVRLMAPFSMRCNTCGEYIYKGRKFNARKETAKGETYYNIKIYRFYIKCTQCSAEITFKTDPKNTDYVCEHGAQRNFENWRDDGAAAAMEETEEERLERLERELAEDPMAELESKQVDSKREMDILDALQEIRTRNARLERADAEAVMDAISARQDVEGLDIALGSTLEDLKRQLEEEEDEAEVRKVFGRINATAAAKGVSKAPSKAFASIELDEPLDPQDGIQDVDDVTSQPDLDDESPSVQVQPVASSSTSMLPPPLPTKQPTVKRKLDEIEPDALSLLSEDARKFASSVSFSSASAAPANGSTLNGKPPMTAKLSGVIMPPKKKNMPSKLGIAPKKKL